MQDLKNLDVRKPELHFFLANLDVETSDFTLPGRTEEDQARKTILRPKSPRKLHPPP